MLLTRGVSSLIWLGKEDVELDLRMNQTMTRLEKREDKEHTPLGRILFGLDRPSPVSQDSEEIQYVDQTLNESQRDAIRFALASKDVALIHGPPGVSWPLDLAERF